MFDCELLHRSYDTLIIVFARQIIVHTSLINILDSLNNNKSGKSSGVDGISAEHFVYVDSQIHVSSSLLFSICISHGYLPSMFTKTAIVLIIKNKTGDTSDNNSYRPIALVTAASKIFELCLSVILENNLFMHDQQSRGGGFKSPPPLRFFVLTHLILELHYCALGTFPQK